MSGGRQRQGYIAANWGAVKFYVNCRGLHRTLLTVNMPFKVFFVVQHFCQDRGSHFVSPLFICLTTQNIMEHCGAQ